MLVVVDSQPADLGVEGDCPRVGKLEAWFFPVIPHEFRVLDEAGLDVVVKQELREHCQLPRQKLVGVVDGGVDDAHSVRADGCRDLVDADGVDVSRGRVRQLLHERLGVHLVVVARDKHVDVPHDLQHVQPLVERASREVRLSEAKSEFVLRHRSHLCVCLPVVGGDGGEVVEGGIQVHRHPRLDVDHGSENVQWAEAENRR
mmetsp:Transcript_44382/g.105803  ORF Transcript_44382/g.105803 Transcript_44382/m.105803 type:complete len:202 (-) Transcript_44382:2048-2653(-)